MSDVADYLENAPEPHRFPADRPPDERLIRRLVEIRLTMLRS